VDALEDLQASVPLPLRVRIYLASGLAARSSRAELAARRNGCGPWVRLAGVKFYADGWLGPRTCAMCQPFTDAAEDGLLFLTADALARRIGPLIEDGWQIATHAIGDRAIAAVLDGYQLAWGGDRAAMAASVPRIEHASLLSADLIARMAEAGVVAGIQPSFATTDVHILGPALGTGRAEAAYPWAGLAAADVRMLAGSDYPIEVLEPLVGLARLVTGRSLRPGFEPSPPGMLGPAQARLAADVAFDLMTDQDAGRTLLTADPRLAARDIDAIEVTGTEPAPF
jgi:predicted amidohydrolase YtcJ